jgi:murein DD-endopeptidase / murein LD-carboxypeptidase
MTCSPAILEHEAMRIDYAERARALVGTRFRPQGRRADLGLDCIGLALCTFGLPPAGVRQDYRMRGDHLRELMAGLTTGFRRVPAAAARSGDLLVLQVATDQLHLAVVTPAGFVHADARLRRVVETPGAPEWPVIAVFRRRVRQAKHS